MLPSITTLIVLRCGVVLLGPKSERSLPENYCSNTHQNESSFEVFGEAKAARNYYLHP